MSLAGRFYIYLKLQDDNGDGLIQPAEFKELLRGLCTGEEHLRHVAMHMLQYNDNGQPLTFEAIVAATPALISQGLVLQNFFAGPPQEEPKTVTLHSMGIVSTAPATGASGGAAAATMTSVLEYLHFGSIARTDPDVLVPGEWRGALAVKDTDTTGLNSFVEATIAQARGLSRSVGLARLHGDDNLDEYWVPNIPTPSCEEVAALCFKCRDILLDPRGDETVVKVPAPAKVFGSIHGHLRDLLAIFDEFGFPDVNNKGDIELASYVFNGNFVHCG